MLIDFCNDNIQFITAAMQFNAIQGSLKQLKALNASDKMKNWPLEFETNCGSDILPLWNNESAERKIALCLL